MTVLSGAVADDGPGLFNEYGAGRLDADAGKNGSGRVSDDSCDCGLGEHKTRAAARSLQLLPTTFTTRCI